MNSMPCKVNGCMKNVSRKGFCYGHYMKDWRYGTPTPEHEPRWENLSGQKYGSLTVIDRQGKHWRCSCACGRETMVLTGDLNRGSVQTCGNRATHMRAEVVGYTTVHERLKSDRGSASSYACADCGNPAQHWSYDHADPNELVDFKLTSRGIAYSLDQNRYQPRCVPCHKIFDLERINSAMNS